MVIKVKKKFDENIDISVIRFNRKTLAISVIEITLIGAYVSELVKDTVFIIERLEDRRIKQNKFISVLGDLFLVNK